MSQTLPSTANVSPRPDVNRVIHEASINHSVSPAGTGGQKHRSALVADGQHAWSFTNPDPSLRRPSPTTLLSVQTAGPSIPQNTPMFGAPPLSYDPAHAVEPQDTVDYQQFIQTHFPTGGQMDYQLQTGHIGNALYPQQLQEMQEMLQPQPQNHFNFVQSQFVSQNQGAYDQSFAPGPTGERLQRRLPRTTRQQAVTKAPVPTQFIDTPHSQLSQHVQASTVMDASFQQQSFTFSHDTPPETYLYANDSRIMSHETLPRQQYRFSEYQHPDQQLVATGPPYTPSELNSYSSSPVSIAEDNLQNSQFVSPQQVQTPMAVSLAPNAQASPGQAQGTGRKAQDKAGKGREKATNQKKRGRTEMRESDSPSDEDEFANIIVPPVTGNELPNRLPGACKYCKRLKMKCDFPPGENTCKRCKASGNTCIVEGRKPRSAPNKREYLLAQIRQKDAIIERLVRESNNPYTATPLSIATYRNATSPSDKYNRNVQEWLDRLEASVQAAGSSGGADAFQFGSRDQQEGEDDSEGEQEGADQNDRTERGSVGEGAEDLDGPSQGADAQALPDVTVPIGLLARLSLNTTRAKKSGKDKAGADADDDNVGFANETYFRPGPAYDLSLRASLIDNHGPPEILVHGLVTPEDVDKLFEIFYTKLNVHVTLLDREIHTVQSTFARCPFLFTVVCAIASRYYQAKSEIYPIAMHFARRAAADGLLNGWKSVELSQAYILLSTYAVPARRWEEDRSWLYIGLAIRVATDLNLHQVSPIKPKTDRQRREILNKERTWLILHNLDRSMATQFGKPSTIREDYIIRNSADWYKRSHLNHPWDTGLSSYTQLLRIMAHFHEEIYSDPSSPTGLNQHLDFREVTLRHDADLNRYFEEWTGRFERDTNLDDPACAFRASLLPFLTNYSRLVMYSFGFQQAYKRGVRPEDQLFLDKCFESAKSVILCMVDVLCPSGYMRYSPDGHFVFASFASAFLLKLMRPEFKNLISQEQETEIFDLIRRLIEALKSPEIAIDDRHTPKLHARFLAGLLTKIRRDTATSGRLQPQPPPSSQPPEVNTSGFAAQPGSSTSASSQPYPSASSSTGFQDNGHLMTGGHTLANDVMNTEPVYQTDTAYTAGAAPMEVFDFNAPNGQGYAEETLGALIALQSPAYWRDMMMPGYSWPESPPLTDFGLNPPALDNGFNAMQAEVRLFG